MIIANRTDISGISENTDIYKRRRDILRTKLSALDALLISLPANRFYLSGFELHNPQPTETSGYIVITRDGRDWLATDSRYALAAERLWAADNIYIYNSSEKKSLTNLLKKCGTIIGYEAKGVSVSQLRAWERSGKYGPVLLPAGELVESMRAIKDTQEIEALQKSFNLNHSLLNWLEQEINANNLHSLTEQELAWEIEVFFRKNGAQELAFSTIVAHGKNGALPHAVPASVKLSDNAPLLVDLGCRVENYCSDQTRTWWLGKTPDAEFTKTLNLVKKAQKAAISIMRPGVSFADVYNAACDIFREAGVEKAFTHGLGHGVGLETHEKPSLSATAKGELEKGMVVTVEPGLYYPQWGGVRWENTVLIEDEGVRIL